MITLRCTQKLLKRLGEFSGDEAACSSRLGDWHGKEVFAGRRRAFFFINDETFVAVLLPAKKVDFREQFRSRYAGLLYRAGYSAEVIASEMRAAEQIATDRSNSRKVLGVLNEVAFEYQVYVEDQPNSSDEEIEDWLRSLIHGSGFARDRLVRLLGEPEGEGS